MSYSDHWGRVRRIGLITLATLALAGSALAGGRHEGNGGDTGSQGNPWLVPPNSNVDGKSYGDWGAAWWVWDYGIPFATNPILDPTGAYQGQNQAGSVYFLAGNSGGAGERTVTIPTGVKVLVPLINIFNDYPCPDPNFQPAPGQSLEDFLAAGANAFFDPYVSSTTLSLSLDGVAAQNLFDYRATSRMVTFTGQPSMQAFDGCITGTPQQGVAAGYWVMLAPLSAGAHTLHFAGGIGALGFSLDMTYHITVSKSGGAQAAPAGITAPTPTTWGRIHTLYR